jgi:hypothetical protein
LDVVPSHPPIHNFIGWRIENKKTTTSLHNEHRETGTNGGEINRVVTTSNYCPKLNNRKKTSYFEWERKRIQPKRI